MLFNNHKLSHKNPTHQVKYPHSVRFYPFENTKETRVPWPPAIFIQKFIALPLSSQVRGGGNYSSAAMVAIIPLLLCNLQTLQGIYQADSYNTLQGAVECRIDSLKWYLHCTLHRSHYTLYYAHYKLHTTNCTLQTAHYKLHTAPFRLHTEPFTVHCKLNPSPCTLQIWWCGQWWVWCPVILE